MYVHKLKLRAPQPLASWMERPQLEQRAGSAVRVVSVVAGPGYGKTVLAAQMHAGWPGPKLWYSLDAADADFSVFATHLDAGMRSLGVALPSLDSVNASVLGSPKELAGRFADGLADAKQTPLVVFDDVHRLEGSRALTALNELVERGRRVGARFIVCGRSMPISLHAIAAAGQLLTIEAHDLTFNNAETESYLKRALGPQVAEPFASLAARAEGWPAGLALIASGKRDGAMLTRSTAQFAAHDDQTRRLLFDYLASEVLDSISDSERRFLLETSILETLETAVCDAVRSATDSAEILASFAKRGLFVSRQSEEAYSCHQLFRDFLQHNLQHSQSSEQIAALHHRAASLLASRGDAAQAITHELLAGDVETAALLLERNALSMLRAGLISAVNRILGNLTVQRIESSPALLLAQGRVQRERGEWDAALASLERAITGSRACQLYDVFAEAVRTCAPILASRGEFERLSSMLDEALPPGVDLPETSLTTLRMTQAAVFLETDRFDESLAIYRDITPSVVARGDTAAHGLILHNTAVAHMRRGDVYAALSLYERALKLKESAGQRISRLTTLGDLIYVKTLLGYLDEAEQLTDTLLAQATDLGVTGHMARAHEQRGVHRLLHDDVGGAFEAYTKAQEESDPSDTLLLPEIEHGLARCSLQGGKLGDADELCARAIAAFRGTGRAQQLAPVCVTRAEVAIARGDMQAAELFATEAIEESERGANTLLQTIACLDAAAALTKCAVQSKGADATRIDRRASSAAAKAVGLLHQRDYRFLLRTKASQFEYLQPHFRRWKIGSALMPDIKEEIKTASLRIEMLGPLRVCIDGNPISADTWKRRKAPDIFAYLLSQRGRGVPRARLIDLYWPESDADAAHDNLRVTITAIRKAVGDLIKYEANAYRFTAPPGTVIDVEEFDAHLEQARQADAAGNAQQARNDYQAAVNLYRGDFLEGMQDAGWQWRERERLHAACLEALRWIAADRERAGDTVAQRLAVERLLEVAPFDLDAVKMRLDALTREMRFAEARRDYEQWRSRYRAAVGVEAPDIWQPKEAPPTLADAAPKPGQAVPAGA